MPGSDPKSGKDQLPPWPPKEPANGALEAEEKLAVSGLSLPGQRQLRSRPAFAPQSDLIPNLADGAPPAGSEAAAAAVETSVSAPASRTVAPTAGRRKFTAWWQSLLSRFRRLSTAKPASPPIEPSPAAHPREKVASPTGEMHSIGDVYGADAEDSLPAWLLPASEPLDLPGAPAARSSRQVEAAELREHRWRSLWNQLQTPYVAARTRLLPRLLAWWQRELSALTGRYRGWRARRQQSREAARQARAQQLAVRKKAVKPAAPSPAATVRPAQGTDRGIDHLTSRDVPLPVSMAIQSALELPVPSSQRPGAPAPQPEVPSPKPAPADKNRLLKLGKWLRLLVAAVAGSLGAAGRKGSGFLRRRARILVPLLFVMAILFAVGRSPRIRRLLDPNPPTVELLVAGPIVRDAVNNTLRVPLRIVLDDEDLDSIDRKLIDEVQISYGESADLTNLPLAVSTLEDGEDPVTRVVEVTLPGSLAGRQIMLQAATSRRQDQVRLSFAAPPAFEIRKLGAAASEYYDSQGSLQLELDGSIKDDDGRYEYEWLVTALDSAGETQTFSMPGSRGELTVTLDASQPCAEYTVMLLARSDTGSVSWSQERRACQQP